MRSHTVLSLLHIIPHRKFSDQPGRQVNVLSARTQDRQVQESQLAGATSWLVGTGAGCRQRGLGTHLSPASWLLSQPPHHQSSSVQPALTVTAEIQDTGHVITSVTQKHGSNIRVNIPSKPPSRAACP